MAAGADSARRGRAPSFMVCLHTPSNTGYAIEPLERVFFRVASAVVGDPSLIHFAYKDLLRGLPETLPTVFNNVMSLDLRDGSKENLRRVRAQVRERRVEAILAFDAPVYLASYGVLRRAGVRALISYQGAPMGSLNTGIRLLLKRLEVALHRHGPDHYIFESEAMRETAVYGRGIAAKDTSVVHLGVDTDLFCPRLHDGLVHTKFHIPKGRLVVVYSGHMEPRKGVRILIQAAVALVDAKGRRDVHFLILGNQPGEERQFQDLYRHSHAAEHVTFGGYQRNVQELFANCDVGCIASTGWDSFTMSAVEMAACGLPLVVSSLQGLRETVEEGVTGLTFPPGNVEALANRLEFLLTNPILRVSMGTAGRRRVLRDFTVARQIEKIKEIVTAHWSACAG